MMKKTLALSRCKGIGAKLREAKSAAKSWVARVKANDTMSIEALEKKLSSLEQSLISENRGNGDKENLKREIHVLRAQLWERYRQDKRNGCKNPD
ncbi:hypothetical protein V6N13_021980 [Hibiscus sabdariffa]|uniref:Uncharacterized protein n=1 Tax=Hibiscus sabdariffa TaxID=183260 RepID=A0ABR2CQ75_9ROSI